MSYEMTTRVRFSVSLQIGENSDRISHFPLTFLDAQTFQRVEKNSLLLKKQIRSCKATSIEKGCENKNGRYLLL